LPRRSINLKGAASFVKKRKKGAAEQDRTKDKGS
jgi:hypothetical protein